MNKFIPFFICILMYVSCLAQRSQDKYLDSLAKKIQFKYKDTILKEDSYKVIKELASYFKRDNKLYNIESHTCAYGMSEKNIEITKKRASMIKLLLVRYGVSAERFFPIGLGEDFPIETCNRETRIFNRRIEFVLRKKKIKNK